MNELGAERDEPNIVHLTVHKARSGWMIPQMQQHALDSSFKVAGIKCCHPD